MEETYMNRKRKFKDLTIRDNFIFAAVMMLGDNCKKFLEMLLGIEIKRIVISYEKTLIYNPKYKGVRMDVYANDEHNTRYDIEMQVANKELGKRTRYYHSQMDMDLLASGHDYRKLPSAYVIFICNFDPFNREKYCYTFENRCLQDFSLSMGDESRSIFLSTEGKDAENIPKELKAFLDFIKSDTPEHNAAVNDAFVKVLQESIRSVKESREMERSFMTLEELQEWAQIELSREYVMELAEELGDVSKTLEERIMSEEELEVLKVMLKAVAKADSLEQFENLVFNIN